MKIATWNVNSIRARKEHLLQWLTDNTPDVLCLQETKVVDNDFPAMDIQAAGYECAFIGQKAYNGVAILSRHPITQVVAGFDGTNTEAQKRLIAAQINGVTIVNAYVPQGSEVTSDKFDYKQTFLRDLRQYFDQRHSPADPVVFVGDINIAPDERDVYSPDEMEGQVSFTAIEHQLLAELQDWGFTDLFRQFETEGGHYSWWDYRQGAFRRNRGMRIDLILTSASMTEKAGQCYIDRTPRSWEKPSDHAPMVASFDLG